MEEPANSFACYAEEIEAIFYQKLQIQARRKKTRLPIKATGQMLSC